MIMRKTALITGGSRGIGFGIAASLAKEGYDLAINGVRDEMSLKDRIQDLKKYNIDVIYCQGNIGNADDRNKILTKAISHFKVINVLINNAGVAPKVRKHVLDLTEEAYDELLDINLKGTFFLTQQVAKHMMSEKKVNPDYEASIVSITSISAEVVSLNRAEYCISKAGLAMMTKLFAAALSEVNIPVYEVRPGIIETDMTSGVKEKYDKMIAEGLTLEKRWGTPEDIGKIVVALVNGSIPYSTGQVINADGGMSIRRL
jgi:NAD(P)-dependent dehydrogenase (short-subunit alcohol dehydrogenase family)